MGRDFLDLTERGRARRLRSLAESALSHYDLDVTRIRLITNSWNCVFRVDTTAGPYAMRVTMPGSAQAARSVTAETTFMTALAAGTNINVPSVIRNRRGELFTYAGAPGVPEERACVVFGWLGGRDIAESVTMENWALLGELMGRMHAFAEDWSLPAGIQIPTYDSIAHYGEPVVVFEPGRANLAGLDRLLIEAWDVTEERISALIKREKPIVTHGDLHQGNVKLKRGVLSPFDFEDLLTSAPILDVATSLFYVRQRDEYHALAGAFRAGYEKHRPWVEAEPGELDRLLIARSLDLLNVVVVEQEVDVAHWDAFVRRREQLARIALGELPAVQIV